MEHHFGLRFAEKKMLKMLEQRTLQFRMIQKRLLNRFKDKNPSPLNNLDFLLNHTYDSIMELALKIEQNRSDLAVLS